jgi:hypothetical protein
MSKNEEREKRQRRKTLKIRDRKGRLGRTFLLSRGRASKGEKYGEGVVFVLFCRGPFVAHTHARAHSLDIHSIALRGTTLTSKKETKESGEIPSLNGGRGEVFNSGYG